MTDALSKLLQPQLDEVIAAIADSDAFRIEIPDPAVIDLTASEVASLVARSSNVYGRLARFAGIARAEAKLAKGRYERAFKRARLGRNEAERNANAMDASLIEHEALAGAEAIAEVAEALEAGARVASESARKLLGAVLNQYTAAGREEHGADNETEYRTY